MSANKIIKSSSIKSSLIFSAVYLLFHCFIAPLFPVYAAETTIYLENMDKTIETGEVKVYVPAGNATVVRTNNKTEYLYFDHLGSTSLVTDELGNKTESYLYYPYGNGTVTSQQGTSDKLYTGQRKDFSSDLYFYNARYYNPSTGLFISADPVPDGTGFSRPNRYAYVGNNPVMRNDPSGNREITPDDKLTPEEKIMQKRQINLAQAFAAGWVPATDNYIVWMGAGANSIEIANELNNNKNFWKKISSQNLEFTHPISGKKLTAQEAINAIAYDSDIENAIFFGYFKGNGYRQGENVSQFLGVMELNGINKSYIKEINPAVLLTIGATEYGGLLGKGNIGSNEDIFNAHVGRDVIFFQNIFDNDKKYDNYPYLDYGVMGSTQAVIYTLRAYQGYLGGGEAKVLGEGGLNKELFSMWIQDPAWFERANGIYNALIKADPSLGNNLLE